MENGTSRRRLLQVMVGGACVALAGCSSSDIPGTATGTPTCESGEAVLQFPHRLYIAVIAPDQLSNAERAAADIRDDGFFATTRGTVDIDIEDPAIKSGENEELVIVGAYEQAEVEAILAENEVMTESLSQYSGFEQRLRDNPLKALDANTLSTRVESINDLVASLGVDLPTEITTNGQYVTIPQSPTDEQVQTIERALEPRGRLSISIGTGDELPLYRSGSDDIAGIDNPLQSDSPWRVDPDSVTVTGAGDARTVVFQMDDDGADYAKFMADAPDDTTLTLTIDGGTLYERPLTIKEQNPPTKSNVVGMESLKDFGPIQMPQMAAADALVLATVLKTPGRTRWPGERIC